MRREDDVEVMDLDLEMNLDLHGEDHEALDEELEDDTLDEELGEIEEPIELATEPAEPAIETEQIATEIATEPATEPAVEEQPAPEPAVEEQPAAKPPMTREQLETLINAMQERIESMRSESPKNHRPGKPGSKVYVRIGSLSTSGKVPQQQLDLGKILTAGMELNQEYTEDQVFKLVTEKSGDYRSLATSRQDPTYLFRYYRGLKRQGNHAGFIARDFLRVK